MKIKKITLVILLSVVILAPTFLFAACGAQTVGKVPEYLGMTVSGISDTQQTQTSSFHNNNNLDLVEVTDNDDIYNTVTGNDIFIKTKLRNPDNFIILSFTLNGYHYQSYQFESGSTGEELILKCSVGDVAGLKEYTIDAIKYINTDGSYKDVKIVGEKTIHVNIRKIVEQPTYIGTLKYGDSLPAITTATTGGTVSLDEGQTLQAGTKSYTWTFTPDGTANYDFLNTTGTMSIKVGRKALAKPVLSAPEFTFSGNEQEYEIVSNPLYTVNGNIKTNAGTYTATVSLNDTANYEWEDGTISPIIFQWTISKVVLEKPTLAQSSFTYDESEHTITLSEQSTAYTLSGDTTKTDIGNYTARVSLNDTVNYEWEDGTTSTVGLPWSIAVFHKVTFNQNYTNGNSEILYANKGTSVKMPVTPERTGYVFTGWYTDSECDNDMLYNFTSIVRDDLELYAGWVDESTQTYSVVFKSIDGDGNFINYYSCNVEDGNDFNMPGIPTLDGHRFVNWYADDDYSIKYSFNSAITADTTIYAKFLSWGISLAYALPLSNYTLGTAYSYGEPVWSNTLRRFEPHDGTDFLAETNEPVMSVYDGTVTSAGYSIINGYYVIIQNDDGIRAVYKSLSADIKVEEGDLIRMGTVIGATSTSMSIEQAEGSHLHLELIENGKYIDPMSKFMLNDK